jgi:uncharacterized protein YjiS (DUF1127 family)
MTMHAATAARIAAPAGRGLIRSITAALELWRQRRALARLDAHRLADLGLDAIEACCEAKRPIWDAPFHWRA